MNLIKRLRAKLREEWKRALWNRKLRKLSRRKITITEYRGKR